MQRKIASFKHILFPDTGCHVAYTLMGLLLYLYNKYKV